MTTMMITIVMIMTMAYSAGDGHGDENDNSDDDDFNKGDDFDSINTRNNQSLQMGQFNHTFFSV